MIMQLEKPLFANQFCQKQRGRSEAPLLLEKAATVSPRLMEGLCTNSLKVKPVPSIQPTIKEEEMTVLLYHRRETVALQAHRKSAR